MKKNKNGIGNNTPSNTASHQADGGRPSEPPTVRPSALQGVKPWKGGSYLTSVGLNDLDTILGGGQPLGTAILLEEDRWTRDLAVSLLKYWCAEVSK